MGAVAVQEVGRGLSRGTDRACMGKQVHTLCRKGIQVAESAQGLSSRMKGP